MKLYLNTNVEFNIDDFDSMIEYIKSDKDQERFLLEITDIVFRQVARRRKWKEFHRIFNRIIKKSEPYFQDYEIMKDE